MYSIGNTSSPAQNVPSPAGYAEVASSPIPSSGPSPASSISTIPLSPDSTANASDLEASLDEGILRAHLLRGKPQPAEAGNYPAMDQALADAVMRELKRHLGRPLFISQTGDGMSGRWASDAWIPDGLEIVPNCTDESNWRCLRPPRVSGKSISDHVRLQFFINRGKPSFSVAQVEGRQIRVSKAIELPWDDPRPLCRAVATAKRACANWSRHLFAAGDEEARDLEKLLLLFHGVKNFGSRLADWLCSTDPEAAMPHPDNAAPTPAPP